MAGLPHSSDTSHPGSREARAPRTPNAAQPRIVILGAGPTGLGAGYRLKELGYTNFVLYDRHDYVGGLAHSFTDAQGFTWDIGGHVMFSHYTYYDQCFDKLMGKEYTLNNRECWVRMMDTWVPYPFQNNVRYLPKQAAFECLSGLIKAQTGKGKVRSAAEAKNFGEFIDAVFGEGIATHFMRPYNYKVWAYPPERMNKHWIGERVAVIDIERALKNAILGTDDFGWGPNNQFKFPLRGGTGEFYKRFGPAIGFDNGKGQGHIRLNKRVASIDIAAKTITFSDGATDTYDILISTMPVDVLTGKVLKEGTEASRHQGIKQNSQADASLTDIARVASGLLHSSGYMVGIGLKSRTPGGGTPDTKSWMYFPEETNPFYRVTYLSNYSPHMTPDRDNYYSLLCEVSESDVKKTPGERGKNPDAVIDDCIRGLEVCGMLQPGERQNIASRWCYYADYSYPTPSVERDDILSQVIPWLEARDIYSRGRFGMWKYEVSNTDHSLMQGVELVNRLVLGETETTIGMIYKITDDGRNAATHERSTHAGSGEKKLAAKAATPHPAIDDGPAVEVKPTLGEGAKPATPAVTHVEGKVGDIDAGDISQDELAVGEEVGGHAKRT